MAGKGGGGTGVGGDTKRQTRARFGIVTAKKKEKKKKRNERTSLWCESWCSSVPPRRAVAKLGDARREFGRARHAARYVLPPLPSRFAHYTGHRRPLRRFPPFLLTSSSRTRKRMSEFIKKIFDVCCFAGPLTPGARSPAPLGRRTQTQISLLTARWSGTKPCRALKAVKRSVISCKRKIKMPKKMEKKKNNSRSVEV